MLCDGLAYLVLFTLSLICRCQVLSTWPVNTCLQSRLRASVLEVGASVALRVHRVDGKALLIHL